MKTLRKEDIKQEVFDLYDAYAHNKIERRDFVQKLSAYAVGGITVASLMSFMMPNYEDTFLVEKTNPELDSEYITYNSPKGGGDIKGLLSKPKSAKGKLPGIVVVHENRGLNPYVEDTARRAALAGFITIAPDALSPLGGYPGNDDEGREMQRTRDRDEMLEDFIAAFEYLKANDINAPLMLQYAGLDERVNAGWPEYKKALKENNKKHIAFFYPDVNHGFHNTSTPRYDKEAAELAWSRTIDFFKENLV